MANRFVPVIVIVMSAALIAVAVNIPAIRIPALVSVSVVAIGVLTFMFKNDRRVPPVTGAAADRVKQDFRMREVMGRARQHSR